MGWSLARLGLTAAALAVGACDQLNTNPERAPPAPATPQATVVDPALRAHVGETYSVFAASAGARYAPDAQGLSAGDRARVWRAMASPQAGQILSGGGTEALVFTGCDDRGCPDGKAVVAVDLGTGDAFIGVHDVGGADVLAPNDRLEALLRLNSPSRSWDDPQSAAPARP